MYSITEHNAGIRRGIMDEGIIIALITGGLAVVSNIIVAWLNSSKSLYRIEQLEKKINFQR